MANEAGGQYTGARSWRWVTERGLHLETGDRTLGVFRALIARRFVEVEDVVPGDGSLLVVLRPGADVSEALREAIDRPLDSEAALAGVLHEIPVVYGGAAGPDLETLAARARLDAAGFAARHAGVEYTVAFLGFQPGFPYLRGLPAELEAPRRATPRVRVAAGSVAIGGAYTGIYPASGPGGWQIIGRTSAVLFDAARPDPALLLPGDRVRFVPDD